MNSSYPYNKRKVDAVMRGINSIIVTVLQSPELSSFFNVVVVGVVVVVGIFSISIKINIDHEIENAFHFKFNSYLINKEYTCN